MPNQAIEASPECSCVQTDVDQFDARYCPAHGPGSEAERRQRALDAEAEAIAAAYLLGEDPATW